MDNEQIIEDPICITPEMNEPNVEAEGIEAEAAVEVNNNHSIKVIIRDLTYHCNEDDLSQLFAEYPLTYIEIKRNESNNHSLLHGFVHLATRDSAQQLVEAFHGYQFLGRKMK